MTAHSGRELAAAVLAEVATAVSPAAAYLSRAADTATAPYAVVHPLGGTGGGSVADQDDRDALFQVTSVGQGPEQALWLADKVQAALVMRVLTVAGRTCSPVQLEVSVPVARDEDVQPPLFYAIDQFRLATFG